MSGARLLGAVAVAAFLSATPAMAQSGASSASGEVDARLLERSLGDLEDMDVYGANGDEIGEVEEVVRRDGRLFIVLDVDDGFLDGNRDDLVVPLAQFRMDGDRLTLPMTKEQIDILQEYAEAEYEDVRGGTLRDAYDVK